MAGWGAAEWPLRVGIVKRSRETIICHFYRFVEGHVVGLVRHEKRLPDA